MTDTTMPLIELLRQHDEGDFLRAVTEAVLQTAVARSSSRPDQRLQPAKRQKTAAWPAWPPSPCSVRKISFTA